MVTVVLVAPEDWVDLPATLAQSVWSAHFYTKEYVPCIVSELLTQQKYMEALMQSEIHRDICQHKLYSCEWATQFPF